MFQIVLYIVLFITFNCILDYILRIGRNFKMTIKEFCFTFLWLTPLLCLSQTNKSVQNSSIEFYGMKNVQEGDNFDAILDTRNNDFIAIALRFSNDVPSDKRKRVLQFIDENIFTGEYEAPIEFYIGQDVSIDGFICGVFIKGDRQIDLKTNQQYYNLTELNQRRKIFVDVFHLLSGRFIPNN